MEIDIVVARTCNDRRVVGVVINRIVAAAAHDYKVRAVVLNDVADFSVAGVFVMLNIVCVGADKRLARVVAITYLDDSAGLLLKNRKSIARKIFGR